jgi:hypothetical protein
MAPKEERFSLVMSDEEKARLEALASAEERSAGAWIRAVINREYKQQFGDKPPKKLKK